MLPCANANENSNNKQKDLKRKAELILEGPEKQKRVPGLEKGLGNFLKEQKQSE
jgi:hypothetical protein